MAGCLSGEFHACEERADEGADREFGRDGVECLFESCGWGTTEVGGRLDG
jgi:hypothetical protein